MTWPGKDTVPPEELITHYEKEWNDARYFYETWRKTTALINPPAPWDDLDVRSRLAICAVASLMIEDALDK